MKYYLKVVTKTAFTKNTLYISIYIIAITSLYINSFMLEKYALSSKGLHEILIEKKVDFLHHANTVLTSLTFIRQGCLLSRGTVQENNLLQTPQKSDEKDKLHEVWDSVFLDGTDHHSLYKAYNVYGPILFKIRLDLLLSDDFDKVYITKSNPTIWRDVKPSEDNYYESLKEVRSDYLNGKILPSQIMFTFRSIERKLDLKKYLHSIIVDDPKMRFPTKQGSIEGRDYLMPLFTEAINQNGLSHISLEKRTHNTSCSCFKQYTNMLNTDPSTFKRFFSKDL